LEKAVNFVAAAAVVEKRKLLSEEVLRLFVSELFFCMRKDVTGCFAALCSSVPDVDEAYL